MLLRSIKLENFRQYKGVQKIEFSTDKEKNVTVIIGKNTNGKTTLVQAFIWCLYGVISFSDKTLLNAEVLAGFDNRPVDSLANVSVELELEHKNIIYRLTRVSTVIKKSKGFEYANSFSVLYSEDGGNTLREHPDKNTIVKEILPYDLSNYFFFWGERIENIDSRKNISEAIKDFLGLSAINKTREHLKSIMSVYTKQITTFDSTNTEVQKLRLKVDQIEEKLLPQLKIELEESENAEKIYAEKYEKYDHDLLSNISTINAKKKVDELENKILYAKTKKEEHKEAMLRNFNNKPYKYFSLKLEKAALDTLNSLPQEEKGLKYQSRKSILELIERRKCICGKCIEKDDDIYKCLMAEIEKIPPKSIYTLVQDFKKQVSSNSSSVTMYAENIKNIFSNYIEKRDAVEEYTDDLQNKKKLIDNNINASDLQKSRDLYKDKHIKEIRNIERLNKEISDLEKQKTNFENLIIQRSSTTEKTIKIKNYLKYTEAVYHDINNDYMQQEEDIRDNLNLLVNEYFKMIYHGDRDITIDSNFKMKLTSTVGDKKISTEESPGLQTVKNFSFIASLVKIAKEKSKSKNNVFELEPYPLVLDAPFSQADEIHIPNICKLISSVAEQTIIVVMDKDWNYAKDIMKDKVGKSYLLSKQSETYTIVKSDQRGEE